MEVLADVRRDVHDIAYSQHSDADRLTALGGLLPKYGECASMLGLHIPVPDSAYNRFGREKPPLTGAYAEQTAAIVREARWYAEATDAFARNARRQASRRIRTVGQIKHIIDMLPEAVTADIHIDSWNVSGSIWPRFSIKDGEQGTVVITPDAQPPDRGRLESEFEKCRLYVVPGGGYVLLQSFMSGGSSVAYSSYSRASLLKYREFLEMPVNSKLGRALRETDWRFGEFQKFIDRLGNNFDGAVRFKVSHTSIARGNRTIRFDTYGFRGENNAEHKRLAVASYHTDAEPQSVDNDYIAAFSAHFNELSLGSARQIIHLSPFARHSGQHTGVIEIGPANLGYSGLFIVLEEAK